MDIPVSEARYDPLELIRNPANQRNRYVPLVPEFDPDALSNWAATLYRRGLIRQAVITLETALSHAPDHIDSHFNMGVLLAEQKQFERALRHFLRAVELRPGDWELLSHLGACVANLGDFELAAKVLRAALSVAPAKARKELEEVLRTLPASGVAIEEAKRSKIQELIAR